MRRCRICKSFRLKKVFSLGKQPLANKLLPEKTENLKTYPLDLYQCLHCTLLQLGKVIPKEELYEEYYYVPSISKTNIQHFKELAKNIKVDPQIPIIRDYFNKEVAEAIVRTKGKAKLVTATNSFAHVDNLHEYLEALDILLDEDGVFFAQFPDSRNLLKENQFDTIYHEHLSYFTYEPLHHLFANTPFELWQITSDNIHGGSMQIWVRRRPELLEEFKKNVERIKEDLRRILLQERNTKKVVAFGAAAKGTVLLNYCDLGGIVTYVVDGTSYKQGKFVPGVNIPIYPESKLLEEKPGTIVLILAWNFTTEIMEKLKGRGFKFIIPVPKVEVING